VTIETTKEAVLQRLLDSVSSDIDKSEGSFVYDTLSSSAIEFTELYKQVEIAKSKVSIDNLSGDELTNRVKERTGLERKLATKSKNYVTITGAVGATVYVGDKVSSDLVTFTILEEKTIPGSGLVTILVECDLYGSVGNVLANTIKYFPVTLANITDVTNPQSFTNGYDEESDSDLLERYYERVQTPPTSGNKSHYQSWAKEVVGVSAAKVFPLWDGDNTVKIVIIDSNKQPASDDLVAQVQSEIDPGISGLGEGKAPLGAFCTVESAVSKTIDVSFTAVKDSGVPDEQILENVSNKITNYFKTIAFEKNQISHAHVGNAILQSNGIVDYSNLTINSGTNNISLLDNEVPVLGGVVIA
jgi:uncharacterized phage protein gp47/JayE